MNMCGCHGVSIIARKPPTYTNSTVEAAMEEAANLNAQQYKYKV